MVNTEKETTELGGASTVTPENMSKSVKEKDPRFYIAKAKDNICMIYPWKFLSSLSYIVLNLCRKWLLLLLTFIYLSRFHILLPRRI